MTFSLSFTSFFHRDIYPEICISIHGKGSHSIGDPGLQEVQDEGCPVLRDEVQSVQRNGFDSGGGPAVGKGLCSFTTFHMYFPNRDIL